MSHFNFETEINDIIRLDGAIKNGPKPRWQRKAEEEIALSAKTSTPNKLVNRSTNKTPSGSPNKKTPGKQRTPKTPSGDRFIPNRSSMNLDTSYYKVMSKEETEQENEGSPSKAEFRKSMTENLCANELNAKILTYSNKAPVPREGYLNDLRVLYCQNKTPGTSAKKNSRFISPAPERILDAPDLIDDYYLNLLDWSCNNHLAVALGGFVYIWDAGTGSIQQLCQMDSPECYVGSVSWIKEGRYLGIGNSDGAVQLWDVEQQKRVRKMTGHAARVGSLSWNSFILTSGSRSGAIHHHDVRVADDHVATLACHTQEVCGLKWSRDGKYLASGGNDNLLLIWDTNVSSSGDMNSPLFTLTDHQAAVKALDWCPFQRNVIASGGGTADRHIRFWNAATGTCLNAIDTKSQVCSIIWSNNYKELVSSHGYAQNQLTIWKYPSMSKVTELTGHSCRVLHMVLSPDGQTVISASADETLRLWKCFAIDATSKKSKGTVAKGSKSIIRQGIR
ncbi:cell division cycle protein 20 homolog [Dendronephthya gigantea]|uniref:cell division cycle protein 20 homolog n=1 Tax=Dendronephthya gigantea TaxID=151771 RepID=UPI00106B6777|nr:cell division cycle protein 20 homolog [Dendronephthya gigantea]XP_028405283.1 cell division cycle protein 20 homolog [Dendronephthya gigantea]XP_028405284.1 cell division cycle protein 20 homolog [Dendronephthya gigantea]